MDWVTAGQVISMVGGIGGFGSIIAFAAFYRVRIRKDKAEARLLEKQGDTESTKPLRDIIDELLEENQRIKENTRETTQNLLARIEKLERQVKDLQEQLDGRDILLNIFKKAGSLCHKCPHIPKGGKCPAVEEYKKLTK